MKNFLAAGLLALTLTGAPAAAATFVNVNDTYTAYMNGLSDSYGGGTTPLPGLLAELTFKFTGFTVESGHNFAKFDYTVKNTSEAPITDSRVSIFAFDVTNATVVSGSTATGDYALVVLNNAAGFPNVGGTNRAFELCFKGGGAANNCSGGGGGGTAFNTTDTGTLKIKLAAAVSSIELNNFGVRWQTLTSPDLQLRGASGVGVEYTPEDVVPEPATWAMLIAGFGLVGSVMRRRRGLASVNA